MKYPLFIFGIIYLAAFVWYLANDHDFTTWIFLFLSAFFFFHSYKTKS